MSDGEDILPLVREDASFGKRRVETGRVRIRTLVDERREWIGGELERDDVTVERVPIGREVDAVPAIRSEGEVIVVPVVEEVLVVEKRLVLREELHVRTHRRTERIEEPVTLRSMRAVVERESADGQGAAHDA